ncbi:MAG: EAL domain-containing protein [Gallionellaceae bacterium]
MSFITSEQTSAAASGGRDYSTVQAFSMEQLDVIIKRKSLSASNEHLLAHIDATPDFVAFSEAKGNQIIFINRAGRRIAGLEENEDVTRLKITDVHPEWANSILKDVILPSAIDANFWHGESALLHRKGHEIPVSMLLTAHKSQQGELELFSTISRDLTKDKRTEAELRILGTAFESQEGMMITDATGVILRVNNAFSKVSGYTAEEAIGQNPRMLKSGMHDAAFYAAMWDSIDRVGAWEGEIWNRRKNGEVYPECLTITAVKNPSGTVTNFVTTFRDISTSKAALNEIKHLAFYDSLTGLPNRRLLLDRLGQALASTARNGRTGALLFIDLDDFKTLNDTLGHNMGDLLLQQAAHRMERCIREGDTIARLGGDEFLMILDDLSELEIEAAAQTESIGNKILEALNQPYKLGLHEYHNSPSIGATIFSDHNLSQEELLKQADLAMYQAKKSGRNTLCFFDPEMQQAINARVALEGELRTALEQQQFSLFYQIQVDDNNCATGAEALIRWRHPERGLLPPAQFISLAEETKLILPIGQWVLETACAQLAKWQLDPITRDLALAVNVNAQQFHLQDFAKNVQAVIQRFDINASQLKLELTESLLLEDIKNTIATMRDLKSIGVQIALDDFGTGYSSLQYLKQLPLDQLKIDRSFVNDLASNNSDKAIVRTIIEMAHNLNMEVIAEGVEMDDQRLILVKNGCTHFQGFLFGKPVAIDEFEMLLRQPALIKAVKKSMVTLCRYGCF